MLGARLLLPLRDPFDEPPEELVYNWLPAALVEPFEPTAADELLEFAPVLVSEPVELLPVELEPVALDPSGVPPDVEAVATVAPSSTRPPPPFAPRWCLRLLSLPLESKSSAALRWWTC